MQNDTITYFLHIPKAGGTTLREISLYNYDRYYRLTPISDYLSKGTLELIEINTEKSIALKDIKKRNYEEKNWIEYIHGTHHSFGMHKYFKQKFNYITMLRNPVDRVISHYYFLINYYNQTHPFAAKYFNKAKNMTLEEFVTDLQPDNIQTRMVSGKGEILYSDNLVSERDFEKAISNMEKHFGFVGLMEEFDKSLLILKQKINWQFIHYNKANVNTERLSKDQIPQNAIDIIKEKNKFDMRLYEYAKKRFETEVKNYEGDIEEDLLQFRKYNDIYKKNVESSRTIIEFKKRFEGYYKLSNKWLENKNKGTNLINYFKKNNYNRIAIYGKGNMFDRLCEELKDKDIKIVCVIDKNINDYDENRVYYISSKSLEDNNIINQLMIDAVVVTPIYAFDSIKHNLKRLKVEADIISLEEIIFSTHY